MCKCSEEKLYNQIVLPISNGRYVSIVQNAKNCDYETSPWGSRYGDYADKVEIDIFDKDKKHTDDGTFVGGAKGWLSTFELSRELLNLIEEK